MASTSPIAGSSRTPIVAEQSAAGKKPVSLLSLPDDLIKKAANWLPVQEERSLNLVCKALRSAVTNRTLLELETASKSLESQMKVFQADCRKLLEKTQNTWMGWLVHKLSAREGFLGKIASLVQSIFLRFSFSFRCEFEKQRVLQTQMARNLKPEAQKETLWFPSTFSVNGQQVPLENAKDLQNQLYDIDNIANSLVRLKARKKAFDSFVEGIGGRRVFYSKPALFIPSHSLTRLKGVFGDQMRLVDLVIVRSRLSRLTDPVIRGDFDGMNFFAVKLKKTDTNETQLRLYEERIGMARAGSVIEWHVNVRNSEVGKHFPLTPPEDGVVIFHFNSDATCVASSDDSFHRSRRSASASLAELRQLFTTGKCDSGWELI